MAINVVEEPTTAADVLDSVGAATVRGVVIPSLEAMCWEVVASLPHHVRM